MLEKQPSKLERTYPLLKAYKKGEIIENIEIAPNIYKMRLATNLSARPGEFFMFRTESFRNSPLLSRPFGVCDEDDRGLVFLYEVVGSGTEIMAGLRPGHEVQLLGPLGNGFRMEEAPGKNVAIVAGGIGLAPLFYLAKKLPVKADFYGGFAKDPYFVDEFRPYCQEVVATSFERDGILISQAINTDDYDIIYACGPNGMLKALHDMTASAEIQISMEAHMACGIGACLGCTVESVDGDFLRVCKDGPVFDSREVFG